MEIGRDRDTGRRIDEAKCSTAWRAASSTWAESEARAGGRSITSTLYERAMAANSGSSVETAVRETVLDERAASMVQAMQGLAAMAAAFLRGTPLEPARARMRASAVKRGHRRRELAGPPALDVGRQASCRSRATRARAPAPWSGDWVGSA